MDAPKPTVAEVEPITPLLHKPFAKGNKGISTSILSILVSVLVPMLSGYLPAWLHVDTGIVIPAIGLSLQNLFIRLRDRRAQKKAAAEAAAASTYR